MVSELLQKITFANFCKPVHNVIIIPVLSNPLNLETVERKGKIIINWISWEWKSFLDQIKVFFIVFEMLSFSKI